MMKKLFLTFLSILFLSVSVFGQQLFVSTKPDPVKIGERLKISLIAEYAVKSVEATLPGGKKVVLTRVNDYLFVSHFVIPREYSAGKKSLVVEIVSQNGDRVKLPASQFMVVESTDFGVRAGAKDGLRSMSATTSQASDMMLKVEELEQAVDGLEQKKYALNLKISKMRDQIASLQKDKAKSREIKKQKKELLKLEAQLKAENEKTVASMKALKQEMLKLDEEQERIKAKQELLTKLEKKLHEKRGELKSKEVSLSKREIKTQKKETLLVQKEKALEYLEEEIESKNKDLEKIQKRLLDQEKIFIKQKKQISADQEQLKSSSLELAKIKKDLETRRKRLITMNFDLQNKRRQLLDSQENLRVKQGERESDLLKQEQLISKKQKFVEYKAKELRIREKDLNKLSKKMEYKNLRLIELEDELKNDKALSKANLRRLKAEQKMILEEKNKFQAKKKAFVNEKKSLEDLRYEIEQKKLALEQQQELLEQKNKQERASLDNQRKVLSELENTLSVTQETLTKLEYEQGLRQSKLDQQTTKLDKRIQKLNKKHSLIEQDKQRIELLEREVLVRYEALNDLRHWVEIQMGALRTEYTKSTQKNEDYINTFDQKFEKLDGLTRLMEKRSTRIENIGHRLARKNRALEETIAYYRSPDYRYGVAPYIALRSFGPDSIFQNGRQGGLQIFAHLNERLSLQGGLGVLSAVSKTATVNTFSKQYYMYDLITKFDVNPGEKARVYFLAGLEGDVANEKASTVGPLVGVGFKHLFREDFSSRVEVMYGRDFIASFGFERYIFKAKKPEPKGYRISHETSTSLSFSDAVEVSLKVPSVYKQFKFKKVSYEDVPKNHWGYSDIINASQLGLMKGNNEDNTQFGLRDGVHKIDAANMLILTYYSHIFLSKPNSELFYSVVGQPGEEYLVSIHVLDKDKKVVKTIMDNESHYKGDYVAKWDGTNQKNLKVYEGDYSIEVTVRPKELLIYTDSDKKDVRVSISKPIRVEFVEKPKFKSLGVSTKFADINTTFWGKEIVDESERLALFPAIYSKAQTNSSELYYEPQKYLTRLEFMVAIAKVLTGLGAEQKMVKVDFTPYRDWDLIPQEHKPLLSTYVLELGYGGDEKQRLRPNDLITKTEVAVIINRVLRWQSKHFDLNTKNGKVVSK